MADEWKWFESDGYRVLSWDWREQPDFAALDRIVRELSSGKVRMAMADTRSDQFALVVEQVRDGRRAIAEPKATEVYWAWLRHEE